MRLEEKKIKQRMSIFSVSFAYVFFSRVSSSSVFWYHVTETHEPHGVTRPGDLARKTSVIPCYMIDLKCPVHTLTLEDETFCLKKDNRTVECAGRARARWTYSNLLLTLVIDMLSYFIVPFSGSKRPRPQKELYKRTVECSVNGFTASFPEGMQTEVFHFLSPR